MEKNLQPFEENLSAIMDGELTGEKLLESIDALVETGELRSFWRDSRSLQKALAAPQAGLIEAPPDSLWDNVEYATGKQRAKVFQLNKVSPQVWAAAASIVLIFSLTVAGLLRGTFPEQANAKTIQLGQNDGRMTEDRFIDLTTELLQADSRYHRKMLEVMQTVNSEVYGLSGDVRSPEGSPRTEERLEDPAITEDPNATNSDATDPDTNEPRRRSTQDSDTPIRVNLW
jgi:hypothetical protein